MKIQYVSTYIKLSIEGLVPKLICPQDQGLLLCNGDGESEIYLYCLECKYKNLPMVNYIMLHRIYDLLSLIASKVADRKDVEKMIEYHEAGYLLGPVPSFNPGEDNE